MALRFRMSGKNFQMLFNTLKFGRNNNQKMRLIKRDFEVIFFQTNNTLFRLERNCVYLFFLLSIVPPHL